jgi:hypothetical protein
MLMDDLRHSLTRILHCFLDVAIESQFVILGKGGVADEFVQFKLKHRVLYGEVGSREGDVLMHVDRSARKRALPAGLGFTHGGLIAQPARRNSS